MLGIKVVHLLMAHLLPSRVGPPEKSLLCHLYIHSRPLQPRDHCWLFMCRRGVSCSLTESTGWIKIVKVYVFYPWLGGSAGWSIIPYTKRLRVRFLVRARMWPVDLVPSWGVCGRQPIDVSLSHRCLSFCVCVCLSLPSTFLPL